MVGTSFLRDTNIIVLIIVLGDTKSLDYNTYNPFDSPLAMGILGV